MRLLDVVPLRKLSSIVTPTSNTLTSIVFIDAMFIKIIIWSTVIYGDENLKKENEVLC